MEKIKSVKKHANFDNPRNYLDVMLPVEELYLPPINIRVLDNRCSGSSNNNNHDWIESLIVILAYDFVHFFSVLHLYTIFRSFGYTPLIGVCSIKEYGKYRTTVDALLELAEHLESKLS